MAKHSEIDHDTFLPRLVDGLRQTWEETRRRHAGETFYMYGISTDSDVTDLMPFSCTEEQYAEVANPEYPIDKWSFVPEAAWENRNRQYTSKLTDEVNRYVFEDHCDEDEENYMLEVIKRINPPASAEEFFSLLDEEED